MIKGKALFSTAAAVLILAFFAVACQRSESPSTSASAEKAATTNKEKPTQSKPLATASLAPINLADLVQPEEVLKHLKMADLKDGSEDHIIGQCAGCSLKMAGDEAYPLEVADYKMHFCSEYCQKNFGEETEKKILTLAMTEDLQTTAQ